MRTKKRLGARGLGLGIAALLTAAAVGVCAAQSAVTLPAGVKAVWDLSKATLQTTATRERLCINGLWLWQPASSKEEAVPTGDWGYFKVPAPWPGHERFDFKECQTMFANPAWKDIQYGDVTEAWYQRRIDIPANWAGQRITLSSDCVNSFAAIYIDGKRAGEVRFPGGEADITAACRPGTTQTLSMLVYAVPLHAVMSSHGDTFGSKQVKGSVTRCGLCGDVWLNAAPTGPRISYVKVDTSVQKWEITFEAGLEALAPDVAYTLKAVVSAKGLPDRVFDSEPFKAADVKDGRFSFASKWHAEQLWDIHTPQNMYDVCLSLDGAGAKPLDTAMPQRFGFREMWIKGRDFYLNGSRVFLFGVPCDDAQIGAEWATYDRAKDTMLRLKTIGVNFVYGHNYGCEPGSYLSYAHILQAADDVGMLFSLPMPHFQDYAWAGQDADQTNGYAAHSAYYVHHVAKSHPSVIAYAMSHNATSYFGMNDPELMDGIADPRKSMPAWAQSNPKLALRAQAILHNIDTPRIIYHHSSGNLGELFTSNFYVNFTPIEELDNWFQHFSEKGVKPIFLCECGSPISWDFSMYRGWLYGGRGFGSTTVPWELCVAQWNAQFYGDAAFQISDQEKRELRWESQQFLHRGGWHHWDYPIQFEDLDATKPTIAQYVTDNFRAFRTWGVSAFNWWEYMSDWELRPGVNTGRRDLKVDWETLQQPGFSADYIQGRYSSLNMAFKLKDWTPDPVGQAILRNNMPLLAYIAGKPGAFTGKDHNFAPDETVDKQVIVINNSRVPVTYEASWTTTLPGAQPGSKVGTIQTGEQERIPLAYALPAGLAPGNYQLNATVKFGDGSSQQDSFAINVMAPPKLPAVSAKIALFDPKGETARLLDGMKIPYRKVEANADLSGYDILVIGKKALTVDGPAPDVMRVKDGLRVIVFEQTSETLETRLGFRVEEYGLRRVFKRVPDSPLLAGLDTDNLRDWRGSATLLPPTFTFSYKNTYGGGLAKWCGIEVEHNFRCGCEGNVASVLIEKPARGNFTPILDGGWSLQFSPLMVFREGKGMVLFCQMDVTGRSESDPAAETLAGNLFRYVTGWKATPTDRKAIYAGDPAGEAHLEHSGIVPEPFPTGTLSPDDDVLVVGKGGGKALAADAGSVGAFIKAGGRVLALGLDQEGAAKLLPGVEMKDEEHISTLFPSPDRDSLLAGIGPADVYNAACTRIPLVTGGATAVGDGVLAKAPDANILFFQLPPYSLTRAEGAVQSAKVDTGDAVDGTNSLLVVMGASSEHGLEIVPTLSVDPAKRLGERPNIHDKVAWTPEVGKTYTFAVMVKGVGSPITVNLFVQRTGYPYDNAASLQNIVVPAGKWTDLHTTFTTDKAYPQGWNAFLTCGQEGGRFRADLFRLYEGKYQPWNAQTAATAPKNWIVNPGFEAGVNYYWIPKSEQFNIRRTYRRISFVMTHLLTNLGVACPTPLLSRFGSPLTDHAEERWTNGLYVDQVEAWDDCYKSFNW